MPNQSGPKPTSTAFAPGKPVSAEQMNRIIDTLAHRIVGDGKNIKVNAFPNGQIVISGTPSGGGGGATAIPPGVLPVPKLPPIPTSGKKEVYWYGNPPPPGYTTPGTGDNQVWVAYYLDTRWYPTQKTSSRSGIPVP